MYRLMDAKHRETMKEVNIYIYRFQTNLDENIGYILRKMYRKKVIFSTFVSKSSTNMVVLKEGHPPTPVFTKEDILAFYSGDLAEFE